MGTAPVAATAPIANPEWKPDAETAADLQGITISAYPDQLFAMLLMVRFPTEATARPNAWIAEVAPRITDASGKRDLCLNLAISAAGLRRLGLDEAVMQTFSRPFREGMTTANRARFLYDTPDSWKWSDCAENANVIHAQLMVYALSQDELNDAVRIEKEDLSSFGLTLADEIFQRVNLDPNNMRHEHFGFADGISQPNLVDGSIPVEGRGLHDVPPGEVLLGQRNTYGAPAAGPLVPESAVAAQYLKPAAVEGFRDLGLSGTYLVIRQLKQEVDKFWNNMKQAATDLVDESGQPATDEWLATKIVGRTLAGDMLTPKGPEGGNDATFFATDRGGFGCPVTSHVRRANPRDGLAPAQGDTKEMIQAANRHRIVRRGRIYGVPTEDRYADDGVDRGLLFLCMNSDIERQFEFVQHTWMLNPMFGAGYNENDPILGPSCPFTIPSKPLRQQPAIETFITPVGGGYFFLPSLSALRYLGAL